jgi:ribosome biogenesis GTPase
MNRPSSLQEGRILRGINNIYTVEREGRLLQCRIKGKVLRTGQEEYNPLAVGDIVRVQPDPVSPEVGWIVERSERRNVLARWNKKRRAVQVIAANADLLVCVSSAGSPPFRPRFLDRLLVSAEAEQIEALIVLNKCDLEVTERVRERMRNYRSLGYRALECSALTGAGLGELAAALRDRIAVFFGQSGAGKSSLLNRMFPDLSLRVGAISDKYDRGAHTTSFAQLFHPADGYTVVDTPGIREFEVAGIAPRELAFLFREFAAYDRKCSYPACQHLDEPGCAVRAAVEEGIIHPDRYESYLRIREDLRAFFDEHHGSPYA